MAEERNLSNKKWAILVHQLPQEYEECALDCFSRTSIEKMTHDIHGLRIYFNDYVYAKESILRGTIEVKGEWFKICPLVTNLTVRGIGRFATEMNIYECMMENYEFVSELYRVKNVSIHEGYETVSLTDDYRIILDIPEMLVDFSLSSVYLDRTYEVLFFCRLCRHNGHMQYQCPEVRKRFSTENSTRHNIIDRRISYDTVASNTFMEQNTLGHYRTDLYDLPQISSNCPSYSVNVKKERNYYSDSTKTFTNHNRVDYYKTDHYGQQIPTSSSNCSLKVKQEQIYYSDSPETFSYHDTTPVHYSTDDCDNTQTLPSYSSYSMKVKEEQTNHNQTYYSDSPETFLYHDTTPVHYRTDDCDNNQTVPSYSSYSMKVKEEQTNHNEEDFFKFHRTETPNIANESHIKSKHHQNKYQNCGNLKYINCGNLNARKVYRIDSNLSRIKANFEQEFGDDNASASKVPSSDNLYKAGRCSGDKSYPQTYKQERKKTITISPKEHGKQQACRSKEGTERKRFKTNFTMGLSNILPPNKDPQTMTKFFETVTKSDPKHISAYVEGNQSVPECSRKRQKQIILSPGIEEAISKTAGVLSPRRMCYFLNHVRRRKRLLEVASHFTKDISALATQLHEIKKTYYDKVQKRGPEEDRDIRFIKNLRQRLLEQNGNVTAACINERDIFMRQSGRE